MIICSPIPSTSNDSPVPIFVLPIGAYSSGTTSSASTVLRESLSLSPFRQTGANADNLLSIFAFLLHLSPTYLLPTYSGSGMSSTNWQDPIYLAFQTQEAHNTWLVLLRSYANPEVYGQMIAADQGGLYRMWRQIELFVLQGRNLGARPKTPDTKRLGSRAGRRKDREREGSEDEETTATATAGTTSGATSSAHYQSIPGDGTSTMSSSDTEHDLFCEIALDNVVSGRTTVKYRTNAPDWFESFMFRDLPGFGSMHINVWRDRKLFGPNLIGSVEISLANFRRGEFVEGWWPVFSPTGNGTQVGEVKLRMRVDE